MDVHFFLVRLSPVCFSSGVLGGVIVVVGGGGVVILAGVCVCVCVHACIFALYLYVLKVVLVWLGEPLTISSVYSIQINTANNEMSSTSVHDAEGLYFQYFNFCLLVIATRSRSRNTYPCPQKAVKSYLPWLNKQCQIPS